MQLADGHTVKSTGNSLPWMAGSRVGQLPVNWPGPLDMKNGFAEEIYAHYKDIILISNEMDFTLKGCEQITSNAFDSLCVILTLVCSKE